MKTIQLKISDAFKAYFDGKEVEWTLSLNDETTSFSYGGCDICNGGGDNVYEATYTHFPKDFKAGDETETLDLNICHQCACYDANGDDAVIGGAT